MWARTRSFLDPDTGRWNAPGLGNSVQTITQDQARRQRAIAQAIAANASPQSLERSHSTDTTQIVPVESPNSELNAVQSESEAIDIILSVDLPKL
ncbi:MAG: hypothetical protein F6K42_16880 [Leptolyngbya sp. SIO1D8]|nr:hypothetical protein [Leptolyngbya sp. SIO1D8]